MKIWLDTDIGSDIDDALALALLLARPDCELLGISTVTEIDNQRAKLASALCRVAGKPEIPIFPGAQNPLLIAPRQTDVPQAAALKNWPHQTDFPRGEAILALRNAVRAHPGEITLLTIGPLTNIGVLLALDPEIAALLKGVVSMCGSFFTRASRYGNGVEWNALLDPHAAALVYRARFESHRSIGLDVTSQLRLKRDECASRLEQSELGRCVLDLASAWFAQSDSVTFHDPLAAAVLWEASLCRFERGSADVELESAKLGGYMHWKAGEGPHEIAVEVDAPRFFDWYFRALEK